MASVSKDMPPYGQRISTKSIDSCSRGDLSHLPFLTCSAKARFFSMTLGSVSFEFSMRQEDSEDVSGVKMRTRRPTHSRMLLEDACRTILGRG